MRIKELFNFEHILSALDSHPWSSFPYAVMAGAPRTGKTHILGAFIESLKQSDALVIHLDCRELVTDDDVLQQAVIRAEDDELSSCRSYLRSSALGNIAINGTFTNSRVTVRQNTWWDRLFGRRPNVPRQDARSSGIARLVEDLRSIQRSTWLVVDHADEVVQELKAFVDNVIPQLSIRDNVFHLRIQRIRPAEALYEDLPAVDGRSPEVYEVGLLGSVELVRWASGLNMTLTPGEGDLLRSISGGHAGRAWECLARIYMDRRNLGNSGGGSQ
jgi:hypothetical protein